jgi:hypothetical protein
MNTKIQFTYKDVPYVLEYNRMAIKQMEASGFSLEEFTKKPMINIDIAFKGLFLKNHRRTNEKLIEEIYDKLGNRDQLIEKIGIMLTESYNSLLDDEENAEGNIEWDTVEISPKK